MLRFIFRKIASKKWMFLALLIGNILLSGIACSNPLYADAVMQRMLDDDIEEYIESMNSYPAKIIFNFAGSNKRNDMIGEWEEYVYDLPDRYGIEALHEIRHYSLPLSLTEAEVDRKDANSKSAILAMLSDFKAHTRITAGRMYSDEIREDGVVEVVVSQKALIDLNLLLNEKRTFPKVLDTDGNPVTVEVVGVYDILNTEDTYWVRSPSYYKSVMFMSEDVFLDMFTGENTNVVVNATWYEVLDAKQFYSRNAEEIYETLLEIRSEADEFSYITVISSFETIIREHISMKIKVSVTLWVLQVPIYILLTAFIFMVSRQILDTEASEIAVLKSRGVRNRQIVGIYFTQSVLISLAAVALGVPLGMFLTQVLGSANAFLEFVSRKALPVTISFEAVVYAAVAAVVAIIAMVFPVRRYTKGSIVTQKQKKARKVRPFWQKAFLDVIALGVSLYGLYTFNAQKSLLTQRVIEGELPDPLLLLCSSLFIIGAGLLMIRIIPLVINVIFHLFRRLWSPALYASFLKVLRQRANQDFIMIFLVMTIALGVFNAQTASTINDSSEKNTRYLTGAEIVVQDVWSSNSDQVAQDPSLDLIYYEPDFGVYQTMEGIDGLAKVFRNERINANVPGGQVNNILLMAIDTDDFGNTAWFDETLLPTHWYHYLNAIAQNARGVLVSSNFRDNYGYEIGDIINYTNTAKKSSRGIIYGFVDYWPTYRPFVYKKGTDGIYRESPNYLIVANLSQVQDDMGLLPYEVWIKAKDGTDFIYDYAETSGKRFTKFVDMEAEVVKGKNDPMLKSLNGVLTVGFIVVLLLCFIGFLMYWILSIRQRTLQFGIYRAMGMSMREIVTMLVNEQLLISVTSIGLGGVIGFIASVLYMPLIQIAYSSTDNALPLTNALNLSATIQLFAIVGGMLLICMIVLLVIIRRMKIAQALKLGED